MVRLYYKARAAGKHSDMFTVNSQDGTNRCLSPIYVQKIQDFVVELKLAIRKELGLFHVHSVPRLSSVACIPAA